ncbi:MAG: hypothetical protein MUE60_01390 [Candidatus Eisenbacteria bacterium]|jgi:hypothetical protein|nr:hypothetical protein [Candidatus Eisenbacteria bacterium]
MIVDRAAAAAALVIVTVNGASAAWTVPVDLAAGARVFRSDTEFRVAAAAKHTLALPWQPTLRWDTKGQMYHVGTLDRDKQNSLLKALLTATPGPGYTLEFSTEGWRRRDAGERVIERGAGASLEGRLGVRGPLGINLSQTVAAIRDRVATAGLAGQETDNGGIRTDSQVDFSRTLGRSSCAVQIQRAVKDVRLDGFDDRTLRMRIDGIPGALEMVAFSNRRRYRTGVITESRTERGRSLRLTGGLAQAASWSFGYASSSSAYQEETNQDFSTAAGDLRVHIHPLRSGAVQPFLKLNLTQRLYDESARSVYDREDLGRALEAGLAISGRDSLYRVELSHQISLDRNSYVDATNFSDHDIRDQRITADLAWRKGGSSLRLVLARRNNDLVYVDAQRSANTVRNAEYSASIGYYVRLGRLRWSQDGSVSARHAMYRFRPESDALSRRGIVASRLAVARGGHEIELHQKWLWDDNGPFQDGLFSRLELIDDVEVGIRWGASWGRWRIAPGIRQRWRLVYGPCGRQKRTATPAQVERRANIDVGLPMVGGDITVAATRVQSGSMGHWEASVEAKHAW